MSAADTAHLVWTPELVTGPSALDVASHHKNRLYFYDHVGETYNLCCICIPLNINK